ncbi:MAG: VCBS repeat-containing protein, partial [Flavobacteriaceae bacterium]|nr:VCBS repeat-containing protein [Flavobacteriaceae bacterium]
TAAGYAQDGFDLGAGVNSGGLGFSTGLTPPAVCPSGLNESPVAQDDFTQLCLDFTTCVSVLQNDSDPNPGDVISIGNVFFQNEADSAKISFSFNPGDSQICITAEPGAQEGDTVLLQYTIRDDADPIHLCSDATLKIQIIKCPDNIIDADCFGTPPSITFGIKELSRSASEVSLMTNPLAGDIDGDGETEIIVKNHGAPANPGIPSSNAILVYGFDKTTNSLYLKYQINVDLKGYYPSGQLAIARVDGNPYASIFYADYSVGTLYKYDFNGTVPVTFPSTTSWTQSWATVYTVNTTNHGSVSPVIADIMGAGRTQVVMQNKVIDTRTGNIIADGGTGMIPNTGLSTFSWGRIGHLIQSGSDNYGYESCPVVIDIDNDGIQEIIGGDCVYTANIVNFDNSAGNFFTLKLRAVTVGFITPQTIRDGGTAVADMDNDGLLDVIVTGIPNSFNATLYIYNPRTGAVLHTNPITDIPKSSGSPPFGPSRPFVGDFDNDGYPEIALTGYFSLRSYKYNPATKLLNLFWALPTTDQSASTTLTVFNFAHDGKHRLVYRDEETLRIIDGSTNPPVVDGIFPNVESPTGNEFPIVADINGDGAAEIIVTGLDDADPNSSWIHRGQLRVYASNGAPWAWARKVWNQASYYATNVNEDLTIPRHPFNPATVFPGLDGVLGTADDVRPFNGFLKQQTSIGINGLPIWLLPDVFTNLSLIQTTLTGNELTITMDIVNEGDAAIGSPVDISLYKKTSPQTFDSGTLITTDSFPIQILPGDTGTVTLHIADIVDFLPLEGIVIRLNDGGINFPMYEECDYTDDVQPFTISRPIPINPHIRSGVKN